MSITAPEVPTYKILFNLLCFLPLRPQCFLQDPLFSTLNIFSFVNVKDQAWYLCQSGFNIINMCTLVFILWMEKERENLLDRMLAGRVVFEFTHSNLQLMLYVLRKYS